MKPVALGVTVLAACIVTGCGAGSTEGTAASESTAAHAATPTSAIPSKLVPPTQINRTGKPEVTFDPCLGLGDAVIEKAGFDPSTRERDDFIADNYAFISCEFESRALILTVASSNLTLPEVVDRFSGEREIRRTRVNGRETLVIPDPRGDDMCDAYVETTRGFLKVTLAFFEEARRQGRQKCEGIVELASIFERELPRDH